MGILLERTSIVLFAPQEKAVGDPQGEIASSYLVQSVCCIGNELEKGTLCTWGLRLLVPRCVHRENPSNFSLPTAEFNCGVRQDDHGPQALLREIVLIGLIPSTKLFSAGLKPGHLDEVIHRSRHWKTCDPGTATALNMPWLVIPIRGFVGPVCWSVVGLVQVLGVVTCYMLLAMEGTEPVISFPVARCSRPARQMSRPSLLVSVPRPCHSGPARQRRIPW
ncbi:hypothetical protein B0I37DRAFT_228730 [Chaetomium sp. MPI-CAGE-AT-0009]|nr:hypothetical protein B0I37DRAFT_228730 [Chaetomium sp. MPI-CAGE-AT-0009]